MTSPPRALLAGPEWLLPDAEAILAAKASICAASGLVAITAAPLRAEEGGGLADALARFEAAEADLAQAQLLIANLTPFRGPHADAGTVFLVGAAFALRRPVYGYSGETRALSDRLDAGGDHGFAAERFDLSDSYAIDCACLLSGRPVLRPERPPRDPWRDLETFRRCVALVCRDRNIRPRA